MNNPKKVVAKLLETDLDWEPDPGDPDDDVRALTNKLPMKVLIIDLYADGVTLDVCQDTPEARRVIEAFVEAENTALENDADTPDFADFMDQNGIQLFDAEILRLEQ